MDLCCFGTQLFDAAEANGGAAAWLQAVGGFAAVFAAAVIAAVEGFRGAAAARREELRQLAQEARELERLRTLRTNAAALVSLGMRRLDAAASHLAKTPAPHLRMAADQYAKNLRALDAQLLSFPYWEMAHVDAADAFAQARLLYGSAASMLETVAGGFSPSMSAEEVGKILYEIRSNAEDMYGAIISIV